MKEHVWGDTEGYRTEDNTFKLGDERYGMTIQDLEKQFEADERNMKEDFAKKNKWWISNKKLTDEEKEEVKNWFLVEDIDFIVDENSGISKSNPHVTELLSSWRKMEKHLREFILKLFGKDVGEPHTKEEINKLWRAYLDHKAENTKHQNLDSMTYKQVYIHAIMKFPQLYSSRTQNRHTKKHWAENVMYPKHSTGSPDLTNDDTIFTPDWDKKTTFRTPEGKKSKSFWENL